MLFCLSRCALLFVACAGLIHAQKYTGPRPPKPDVPFLLHAQNLVETEQTEAKEEKRRDEIVYAVPGNSSPARTPLAEPIFLFQSEKILPEKLELYKLEVRSGRREIAFPQKKKRDAPRPLHLSTRRLDGNLFRVEANEMLENGEYSLTPSGSNQVFCFQVY